ncbi:hypothetical protein, partial [Pseudomonas sp. FEN]
VFASSAGVFGGALVLLMESCADEHQPPGQSWRFPFHRRV